MRKFRYLLTSLAAVVLIVLMSLLMTGCGSSGGSEEAPAEEAAAEEQAEDSSADEAFTGDMILSAEEAAAKVGDEGVIFVDCTGEKGKTVKGAVALTWQDICTCSEEYGEAGDDGWGKIPEASDLAVILGSYGLDKNKEIITLGHTLDGWGEDARVAWELLAAGYTNVKIVDGGIDALLDAGVEKGDAAEPVPCEVVIDKIDMSRTVETKTLEENFDSYKFADVRTQKEYDGATKYGEKKGGHIKGAVLVPYLDFFKDDGTLKSNDEITALFENAGFAKDDNIVAYCTGGIRSAYAQMILEMCGFEHSYNYDQSYWNWCVDNEVD